MWCLAYMASILRNPNIITGVEKRLPIVFKSFVYNYNYEVSK